MRRGRYYMARVIKLGELNQTKLLDAIVKAPTVVIGQSEWTITDVIDMSDATIRANSRLSSKQNAALN